jgi:tripartite-type tricarboxylate transporter receptor subunit TctC
MSLSIFFNRYIKLVASFICLSGALVSVSNAQTPYPNRPITMIVPFAAGGSSDVIRQGGG